MADEKQLEILSQGVDSWNHWRKHNPGKVIDLSEAKLSDMKLSAIDLSEVNLSRAYLIGADLSRANLRRANLSRADFSGANLSLAHFGEANLFGAKFFGANLSRTDFNKANLMGSDLSMANLRWSDLSMANLRWADLTDANLSGANLADVKLSDADLTAANLSEADLSRANLTDANLSKANLTEANVTDLKYNRRAMKGRYSGIRADGCFGNAIFKRDAQDQDFFDILWEKCNSFWQKQGFRLWGWIDYGRDLRRIVGTAIALVLLFGAIYARFPGLLDYGTHKATWFTPYFYSIATYVTFGVGRATPNSAMGEMLVAAEVVLGYITIAALLSIVVSRLMRRS